MSDTTCPECAAPLREGATFCTSCGHRIAATAPPSGGDATQADAPGPGAEATRVDNPALSDATQTFEPPTPPAPGPGAPWEPAQGTHTPPPTSAPSAPAGPPPNAPSWGAPPQQAAPPWQQAQQAPQQPWGQQPYGAPAHTTTSSSGGGSPIGAIVAILGAVLTLVGLFTAWIGSNVTDDTITGWALASGDDGFESNDPYIILALGVAALVAGVMLFTGAARSIVRIAAVVVGVVVVGVAIRDWLSIADIAKDLPSSVEITAQFGFYLTIAGGVVTAIAAVVPGSKESS